MNKLKKFFSKMRGINILKTIYVNFAYFPLGIAIKLPVFVYGKVEIKVNGLILISPSHLRPGILNIGTPILGYQHSKEHTCFNIKGKMSVNGKVIFGKGCSIEVGHNAVLNIGDDTIITGNTTISCSKEITIANRCMISWDNLIMDNDWHNIVAVDGGYIFPKKAQIVIGNHVWICCRCTILKGTNIGNDSIVASNSKLTKTIEGHNILIGSNTILKTNVTW